MWPAHNRKPHSYIRKRVRRSGNGFPVHVRTDVRCALLDRHEPSSASLQDYPLGSQFEALLAKPSIAARELEPLQLDDTLVAGLKSALPFEHSVVPL